MESLVAFIDILGTKTKIKKNIQLDAILFDFVNIVAIEVSQRPLFRFAALTDTVILSCDIKYIDDFVYCISNLANNWFADHIFIRGGISIGDINWVDIDYFDVKFKNYSNIIFARVYGKALVEALEIQEKSGPGAIFYVSEKASNVLKNKNKNYILEGLTDMLVWTEKNRIGAYCRMFNSKISNEGLEPEERRHLLATKRYFSNLKDSGKGLEPIYPYPPNE